VNANASTETLRAHHSLGAGFVSLLEGTRAETSFVRDLRERAMASFQELGFPNRRLEAWRFTNTRSIADTPWTLAEEPDSLPDIGPWSIEATHVLVLVDGIFRPELSSLEGLPDGVVLCGLADTIRQTPALIEAHLGRHALFGDHSFVALNTALFRDGAVLLLAPNSVLEGPVHLLHVATDRQIPTLIAPRNLIVAGHGSQATIVEHFAGLGAKSLSCPVTEIVVGEGAVIEHHKLHEEPVGDSHVSALQVRLARSSAFTSHSISIGGSLVRNDIGATLVGEGADCTLNGLYLTEGRQHVDNQIRVRHAAPHCTSYQLYKGILDGASRTMFSGRIVVDKGAQKTDAKQSNRNLLLSEGALAHSNPQLEIFADDVRCTHGSTVGRLDEDAVFYLRSRGLKRAAAESLLTYAFASEVVGRIKIEPLRRRLEGVLFDRLPQGDLVREAV
jgi:Fe-S cluster assembly protein SufD